MGRTNMRTITSLLLLTTLRCATAQPGTVDTTFHSHLLPGNGDIRCVLALPDGKALIGGSFTTYDGIPVGRIARLLPDGSLDNSFMSGSGFDGAVSCMALRTDGYLLVGGNFDSYAGSPSPSLVRLDPEGTLDADLQPELSDLSSVLHLALHSDGRILVAGNGLKQLMPDGSADPSFTAPAGSPPASLCLLSDGRIMLGRSTTSPPFHCLTRLLADGSVDSTFTSRSFGMVGLSWASVDVIYEQVNGAYVVGGHFDAYDDVERIGLARIQPGGALDTNYHPAHSSWPAPPMWWADVSTLLHFEGERLMIPKFGFNTRLYGDGSMDEEFHRAVALQNGDGHNASITGSAYQPDGKILVVGRFEDIDGSGNAGIARLNDCVIGSPCDDGETQTIDDAIDALCVCSGELSTAIAPPTDPTSELTLIPDGAGSGRFIITGAFATDQGTMTLTVHDLLGRAVYEDRVAMNAGMMRIEVGPPQGIGSGIFMVTLNSERFRWTQRLHLL